MDARRQAANFTAMAIPLHLQTFWNGFAQSRGGIDEARFYDVCIFGDSEEMADELADLVLRGVKRATAGSLWSYEDSGVRAPRPGDLSIVIDGAGVPLCVIETLSVEVVPYNEVTAEFAAIEGEGDGSLSYWLQAHKRYFERECTAAGRAFSPDMLLACECFEVVYRLPREIAEQARARRS